MWERSDSCGDSRPRLSIRAKPGSFVPDAEVLFQIVLFQIIVQRESPSVKLTSSCS